LTAWQVGEAEDKRLSELNKSLEAVYEVMNKKLNAPRGASSSFSQIRASLKAWRALRRSTDPSTKDFLLAMERIRREYDDGVMALTSTVQPLTDEEVRQGFERAGGKEIQRVIEEGVDSAITIQHAIETAFEKSIKPLNRPVRCRCKERVCRISSERAGPDAPLSAAPRRSWTGRWSRRCRWSCRACSRRRT
jgi:hypothetical protein